MSAERRAVLMALAAVALWSTVATGFKLGLRQLEPLQLLWLGSVVSWVFFGSVYLWQAAKHRMSAPPVAPRQRLGKRQIATAVGLGILNPFAYYVILFEAYDRLPAQIAQPLNYTWAITLAVLAIPLLKQRLTARMGVGIALGYAGVVVLVTRGQFTNFGHFDTLGVLFALCSTIVWAGYWLLTVRAGIAPVTLMLVSFTAGTPLVAIACQLSDGLPEFSGSNLFFGAWVGLIEMGVTFLLWQRALMLTSNAARISQLIFISPFVSFALIAYALGEAIHPSAIVGLTLIVAGLLAARERTAA